MAISALAAAKRICERSGWTISNLKLQKILYMAQMAYMGENNGAPLITGHFEAWNYGPVEPEVYRTVSRFGRQPIQDIFGEDYNTNGCTPEACALDRYTDQLLQYTAPRLVSMTHWEGGAWAQHYHPEGRGIIIPPEDIMAEYQARVQA